MEQIKAYGLEKFVNKIDYLPHDQVINEQNRSKILLLLVNNTKNAKGILTGKFFEYMASGSPILAIGPPDGELANILHETGTGLISDFNDVKTLEAHILSLYSGKVTQPNKTEVNKYTRRNLTQQLCMLLSEIE